MLQKSEHWAIIGGGILGMTLAHRLAQEGKKVTLFEAAKELGGLASAWNLGDVVWDRHYHVTLLSDTYFRSLLTELGLEQEMQWVETHTGFYTDGKFYSMSNSLDFLLFPPLGWLDKIRLGITILYASRIKHWQKLEQIPVDKWLRQWSGSKTFEKIWLPLLRAKLGENYRKASAAFIWAIIARLYAARRTGLKKEMFGYLPGGYARILQRFAEVLTEEEVDIKLQHIAKIVQSTGNGKVCVEFQNDQRHVFDQVVLTTAAPIVAQICSGLTDEELSKHKGIQYQGVICASLLLKKPLSQYYVTNITDSWVPFTGIIEMSTLVDHKHFNDNSLVYIPKYVTPEDPAFLLSDHELEDIFLGSLMRMYPHLHSSDILCFRVSRVRYVLAISTLNYSRNLPSISTSIPGVSIVNSAQITNGTLNVNETIQLAEKTIKKLLLLHEYNTIAHKN
ncbi:MAG: NAD(P)/FAD-dependent oxidoreductase [Aulosira sp. ZfuVER01]|nr:NAD(P)/FAD-dependent oxidoreductase [Aulosira sp. ZfuVER01]MDZ8000782.1 NAD(P)/FAD-dependent oxidoreductase [Aulosira sp. DedVER01a]MDZ8055091.1 NAD(P)/FAD-dependent oxidoreductase [Aulosira sp. ZfuCHP01]